ncbi:MAG: tetratricopeptide repeat protein, partial [Candidatus Omnitrophica bacterium]|nr:tetratricopeptide repeat protein [Candidatus Omnitrophota bacterium]
MSPNFYQSWLQLGALDFKHHQLQEAAQAFERARRAYPYAVQAYLGLAQAALAQGDAPSALSILDSGLRTVPHDPMLEAAIKQIQP